MSSLLSSFLDFFSTVGLFMTLRNRILTLRFILQPIMTNFVCVYSSLHICFVCVELVFLSVSVFQSMLLVAALCLCA